jgi:hypothetical protein
MRPHFVYRSYSGLNIGLECDFITFNCPVSFNTLQKYLKILQGIIRIRKSKKDRQYNSQQKKDNNPPSTIQKTTD